MAEINENFFWHAGVAKQWSVYKPPITPSKSECQIIKRYILKSKKKNLKILILGSTPEFRDLAHQLRAEVFCIDVSFRMLQGLVPLMKNKSEALRETWIISDWLKAPLKENYFDFILGDFVIGNLPIKLWSDFFVKMKSLLNLGGFFITRHYWVDKNLDSGKIVEKVLRYGDFKGKPINVFSLDILMSVWRKRGKEYSLNIAEVNKFLERMMTKEKDKKKQKRMRELINLYKIYYPSSGKTWWALDKDRNDKLMKKYFKVDKIEHGDDHPCVYYCPIYFLKKC